MELTVLGSGTAVPSRRRGAPGYLVKAGRQQLLIECGAGTLDRMMRFGMDPRDVDRIVLSHHHLDHYGELAHFLFGSRLPGYGRQRPLVVAGSAPLLRIFRQSSEPFGAWLRPREYPFSLHDLDARPLEGDGFRLTGYPVAHIASSRAFRIRDATGVVLAYSGDTDVCDGVLEAGEDADLLVIEASFPEGAKRPGHLVPSEAGRLGRQARARRLLLTHFYPECDSRDPLPAARSTFDRPVWSAEDGMVVDVGSGAVLRWKAEG
ncbi:MAG: MBL fold metallo-hydrolase [Acidobacteriota bacterium]